MVEMEDADYVQPRKFYAEVIDDAERSRLHMTMAGAMAPCSESVRERWFAVLGKVLSGYEAGVRGALNEIDAS